MLAARIHFDHRLVDRMSSPSLNFTHAGDVVTMHITIVLDKNAFRMANDEDHTNDPVIKKEYRDARIGKEFLSQATLGTIEISEIDEGEGAAKFTLQGTIATKIPGTGSDFKELKEHNFLI